MILDIMRVVRNGSSHVELTSLHCKDWHVTVLPLRQHLDSLSSSSPLFACLLHTLVTSHSLPHYTETILPSLNMTVIKKERGGSNKSKGGGGGGGGGSKSKGGGGGDKTNNPASQQKNGPLHPSCYVSKKRMLEALRCDETELDLLKHGAAKIVKKHPTIHNQELRWELSDQESEWAEMLSGERWEGEEFPRDGGFEKEIGLIMMRMKGDMTRKINGEKKKMAKRGDAPGGRGGQGRGRQGGSGAAKGGSGGGGSEDSDDDDGDRYGRGGGQSENRDGGRSENDEGDYVMSGGLSNDTPIPRPRNFSPKTFQKLDWLDKDTKNGNGGTANSSKPEEEELYYAAPPMQQPGRPNFPRTFATQLTPTPASRYYHPSRMFQEDEDDSGFVGVYDAAPVNRDSTSRTHNGNNTLKGGSSTNFIDLCSDSE